MVSRTAVAAVYQGWHGEECLGARRLLGAVAGATDAGFTSVPSAARTIRLRWTCADATWSLVRAGSDAVSPAHGRPMKWCIRPRRVRRAVADGSDFVARVMVGTRVTRDPSEERR